MSYCSTTPTGLKPICSLNKYDNNNQRQQAEGAACFVFILCLVFCSILGKKIVWSLKIFTIFCQTKRRHIPEYIDLHSHHYNLKYNRSSVYWRRLNVELCNQSLILCDIGDQQTSSPLSRSTCKFS